MADPRIPANELAGVTHLIKEIHRRLAELEKPDSTQLSRIVEEVKALVEDLDQRVQGYITTYSMTRDEVIALAWMNVLWPGKGGTGTSNAYNNPLTVGPRRTAWVAENGTIGHTDSVRASKQDVRDASVDLSAWMSLPVQQYRYKDDVARRGPEAETRYGFIAEDLASRHLDGWLYEGADGQLQGVAYEWIHLAQHEVLRKLWAENYDHRWRISELEARADAQQLLIDDLSRRLAAVEGGSDATH